MLTLYNELRAKAANSPLCELLPSLLILANDLGDSELDRWAQLELGGYVSDNPALRESDVVPEYRAVSGQWLNDYGQVFLLDDQELAPMVNSYRLRNGVAELEQVARSQSPQFIRDLEFPSLIREHLQVQVTQFKFLPREVNGVLSNIRMNVIQRLSRVRERIYEMAGREKLAAEAEAKEVESTRTTSSVGTVFYSWQSDLPNSTNRGFIEDSLERAIRELKADPAVQVEPCLDRDTQNVPGSPDIAATIFDKIDRCSLFVCDVSIVNSNASDRPMPNPNVLIELGYAVKTLGWNRIVCVFNQGSGRVEDLPFDLRQRRVRCYRLNEGDDKAEQRKVLTRLLKADLERIFVSLLASETIRVTEQSDKGATSVEATIAKLKQCIADDGMRVELHDLITQETEQVRRAVFDPDFLKTIWPIQAADSLARWLMECEARVNRLLPLFIHGCRWGKPEHHRLWIRSLERLGSITPADFNNAGYSDLVYYPALLLLYGGGLAAIAADDFRLLNGFFSDATCSIVQRAWSKDQKAVWIVTMLYNYAEKFTLLTPKSGFPVSDYLHELLRDPLRLIEPDDRRYHKLFDRVEYLSTISYADTFGDGNMLIGRFGRQFRSPEAGSISEEVETELQEYGDNWPPLKGGICGGSSDKFLKWKRRLDEAIRNPRRL